jgi:ribosomal RNA-processing protein 9
VLNLHSWHSKLFPEDLPSSAFTLGWQASGAADGVIRLWAVREGKTGAQTLDPIGGLPARGFVNALHLAHSGRFVLAGTGQEPRLGRWARDGSAKNGLLLHMLSLDE